MTHRILIADDSPDVLASMGRILREADYQVTSTNSGMDALCLLRSKPSPDLLILDLVMPGLDGKAVLEELGPSSPPVLVISGNDEETKAIDRSKIAGFLAKPFDDGQLKRKVAALLSSMKDTTLDESFPMTDEQRAKAIERRDRGKKVNGGV